MSECIVRIDMPSCCDECPMEYDGFMCAAIHKRFYPKKDGRYLEPLIDPNEERLPDCPILAVLPEKHGDLIDRDAVVASVINTPKLFGWTDEGRKITDVYDAIVYLPTIVPATEGGKE